MRKSSAWLLAFALLPAAGWAEDLYRVEILIFMQPTDSSSQVQHFESTPDLELDQAVDFRQYFCLPARSGAEFIRRFLSEEEVAECLSGYLRLNELRQPMVGERIRLEKSGQYRILHHAAWQQLASLPDEAHPVRLTNGKAFSEASPNAPALDGSLRLSKEQFLQIDLNLLYHYPTATSDPDEESAGSDGLLLQVSRKLRSGDLNYIDHPLIGVLAQVTPVEEDPLDLEASRTVRVTSSAR